MSRGLSRSKEHLESLCLTLFIFLGGVCVCVFVCVPNSKFLTGLEITLCLPDKLVSRQVVVAHACNPSLGRWRQEGHVPPHSKFKTNLGC